MADPQIKISYANSCSEEKWNKIFGKKEESKKKYLCHEYGKWCDLDNKEHIGAMCTHCDKENN